MSLPGSLNVPILRNIFHPSDFSPASESAFAHALRAALMAQANLTILHVSSDRYAEWMEFPGVRAALERWGLLPMNSRRSDVAKLGIHVKKVQAVHPDPIESVTSYLAGHAADLIVLATDQNNGGLPWLTKSVAMPVALASGQMTLFIPKGAAGFVSSHDGSVSLTNILIPVTSKPPGQAALQAAVRMAYRLNRPVGVFTVLHVGEEGDMPDLHYPDMPGWQWDTVIKQGDVVDVICGTAEEIKADLIVMTTEGRHGFLDALRGSHSERVLHKTPCPLLAIPAGGFLVSVLEAESEGRTTIPQS
ncbi:MAG: universal stress protein [Nitrospira sp. LK70]|nr:universal stress protein [Nitrospira sp. LK70]